LKLNIYGEHIKARRHSDQVELSAYGYLRDSEKTQARLSAAEEIGLQLVSRRLLGVLIIDSFIDNSIDTRQGENMEKSIRY
jgi:hypothetical protein